MRLGPCGRCHAREGTWPGPVPQWEDVLTGVGGLSPGSSVELNGQVPSSWPLTTQPLGAGQTIFFLLPERLKRLNVIIETADCYPVEGYLITD